MGRWLELAGEIPVGVFGAFAKEFPKSAALCFWGADDMAHAHQDSEIIAVLAGAEVWE